MKMMKEKKNIYLGRNSSVMDGSASSCLIIFSPFFVRYRQGKGTFSVFNTSSYSTVQCLYFLPFPVYVLHNLHCNVIILEVAGSVYV